MQLMSLHQSTSVYMLKQALGLAVFKTPVRAAVHLYPQMQQLPEVGCFTQ